MKEKQISFLSDCLDVLEDIIRSEEERQFFNACLCSLEKQERLTRKEVVDIGHNIKEVDPRTYVNWLDWFIEQLAQHKARLWQNEERSELSRFPMLKKSTSSGGSGKETYFYIEPVDLIVATTEPKKDIEQVDQVIDFQSISYRTTKLKHTPWYLKLCDPLFKKMRYRQILLLLSILYSIGMPVALGLMLVTPGNSLILWGILFVVYCFTVTPFENIRRIIINKITMLNHLFHPLSAVCISEVTGTIDSNKPADASRRLVSVQIDGKCPVCSSVHGLENSITLERESLFKSRIIGRCLNNPQEHLFTFDKDLMSGNRIIK